MDEELPLSGCATLIGNLPHAEMSLDIHSAKGLEFLRGLRKDELQQWMERYFRELGWKKVSKVPAEKDLTHGCDLLLTTSIHGEPVRAGAHVEAGLDVADRLDALREIAVVAEKALRHHHGDGGRERLYKFYWITTGSVGPTARDEILQKFEGTDFTGRVEVWDVDSLLTRLGASGLLTELERTIPALRVFVSYASEDWEAVAKLRDRLRADGFNPWLDKDELLPGQAWELEIRQAMRQSDAIIVCLSEKSVRKTGFVQQELRHALDLGQNVPEGAIYVIPVLLDDVNPPESLRELHWTRLLDESGYQKLVRALRHREKELRET